MTVSLLTRLLIIDIRKNQLNHALEFKGADSWSRARKRLYQAIDRLVKNEC